jgi:hypothetical protein
VLVLGQVAARLFRAFPRDRLKLEAAVAVVAAPAPLLLDGPPRRGYAGPGLTAHLHVPHPRVAQRPALARGDIGQVQQE